MNKKYTFDDFKEIIKRLRAEDGCPWDREQTHASLKPCMAEEAAEVFSAINLYDSTGNSENLAEELGDVLLQVVMHAVIAEEEGLFTIDDVIRGISEKMIRRHPHVFGETEVSGSGEVLRNWDEIKKKEKAGKEQVDEDLQGAVNEMKECLDRALQKREKKLCKNAGNAVNMGLKAPNIS